MNKNKQRFFAFTVALLAAAAFWGMMLTGTALAQSTQPDTPAPGWHHDMMAGHIGQGMMSYGMQASGQVSGTAVYAGRGMMGSRMGEGMMASRMGQGMMDQGMMDHDRMDHDRMAEHMGHGAMGSMPMTGNMPYECPYKD